MKQNQNELVEELKNEVEQSKRQVQSFQGLTLEQLNFKANPQSWSLLECIEHLNLYGDFYLPEIESQQLKAKPIFGEKDFRSGFLGNYFANSMLPKNGVVTNKMNTFKDKNPSNSNLNITVIDRFLKQQDHLIHLLIQSKNLNLTLVKTGISISPFIRIRLGDTYRFLINHQKRHFLQMQNIKKSLSMDESHT